MDLEQDWPEIRRIFARAPYSSIASVDADGLPHVSPIGSLVLLKEPGRGFYFERFTANLPRHLEREANLCAMAVDMRLSLWLKALLRGGFPAAPGLRLAGRASELRDATEREVELFQRRVRPVRWTKGYQLLWSGLARGREVHFDRVVPLRIGRMWPPPADLAAA
ncbi:MAG: pyridoxamine 5'-phosphate oxidase family protein [Acidobacteriota bacterium]